MTQQGEKQKARPGTNLITWGVVALVVGVLVLVMNFATTHATYVPGVGTVTTQGTPSPGAIILLVVGLLLAGIGFARRLLAAVERR